MNRKLTRNILEFAGITLSIFFLIPLVLVLINSAKSNNEITMTPLALPENWINLFKNIATIWASPNVGYQKAFFLFGDRYFLLIGRHNDLFSYGCLGLGSDKVENIHLPVLYVCGSHGHPVSGRYVSAGPLVQYSSIDLRYPTVALVYRNDISLHGVRVFFIDLYVSWIYQIDSDPNRRSCLYRRLRKV